MKRSLYRLICLVLLFISLIVPTNAFDFSEKSDLCVTNYSMEPYASAYLSNYSIGFGARDNCRMVITMDVNAVHTVDKVGCIMLVIENKIDGTWYEYDTLFGIENPDFYMYDTASYLGSYEFYGEPGVQYRATMTAFAQDSTGYDTGDVTSYVVTCRE